MAQEGVDIPALGGARIHPHYGVFSPVRGEYVDLVAKAPLPSQALAFDIGTGTGVLAAVLAKRGVKRVVGTDQDARARLRPRKPDAPRAPIPSRSHRGRSLSRGPRAAHRVQSAVASGTAKLADRTGRLRPG